MESFYSKGGCFQNEIDDEKMELTVKIAKLLLEAGCDPTCKTKEGRTALMMAVEQVTILLNLNRWL